MKSFNEMEIAEEKAVCIDTLWALEQQESTTYAVENSLFLRFPLELPKESENVDFECRHVMATWWLNVLGVLKFSAETAEIAMSYLNRFVCSPKGEYVLANREAFRLLSITCLYTAIKLHEPITVTPKVFSHLCENSFSPEQIETMERLLLQALNWRLNPPTAMAFARIYVRALLFHHVDENVSEEVFKLVQEQSTAALLNYNLMATSASAIAFCSIINVLTTMRFSKSWIDHAERRLLGLANIPCGDDPLENIRVELRQPNSTKITATNPSSPQTSRSVIDHQSRPCPSPKSVLEHHSTLYCS